MLSRLFQKLNPQNFQLLKKSERTHKWITGNTRISSVHRDNAWHPYWDSRTKWTLLGLYKQKGLFFPKRSSCAQLKILLSKVSDKMARKRAWFPQFFLNSSVNKMLWKGTIPQSESPSDPMKFSYLVILHILCFHLSWVSRWWEYSRPKFFSYKWSSARITIKNSFGLLKARFRCSQRVVDINIPLLKFYIFA